MPSSSDFYPLSLHDALPICSEGNGLTAVLGISALKVSVELGKIGREDNSRYPPTASRVRQTKEIIATPIHVRPRAGFGAGSGFVCGSAGIACSIIIGAEALEVPMASVASVLTGVVGSSTVDASEVMPMERK